MPDVVGLDVLAFCFAEGVFLDPSHDFPALELNHYFLGVDGFGEVEEDVSGQHVACEVEGLVELDKGGRHWIKGVI